jgi:hypothetical protein
VAAPPLDLGVWAARYRHSESQKLSSREDTIIAAAPEYGPLNPELGVILIPGELAKIRADEFKTAALLRVTLCG